LLEGGDIVLVGRRIVVGGIDAGGGPAHHRIAHSGKGRVVGGVPAGAALVSWLLGAWCGGRLGRGTGLARAPEPREGAGGGRRPRAAGTAPTRDWRAAP